MPKKNWNIKFNCSTISAFVIRVFIMLEEINFHNHFRDEQDLAMTSSPGGSTTVSQKILGFLIDAEDVLQCEVCMEPFDPEKRPPKLLPCGHNFCEHCLFNLCCHQQVSSILI